MKRILKGGTGTSTSGSRSSSSYSYSYSYSYVAVVPVYGGYYGYYYGYTGYYYYSSGGSIGTTRLILAILLPSICVASCILALVGFYCCTELIQLENGKTKRRCKCCKKKKRSDDSSDYDGSSASSPRVPPNDFVPNYQLGNANNNFVAYQ